MSRHGSGSLSSVARRLRYLRGEETQEAFAKRVGVSRSALANYETGRSKPDDYTLQRIAENTNTSMEYFVSYVDPLANSSMAALVGAAIEGVPDWTDDEATLVRMLRLCDDPALRDIVRAVNDAVGNREVLVNLGTVFQLKDDLQRLLELAAGQRTYERGPLAAYPKDSPMHRIGFKDKA
jgi:transcriptional regulator with XRE-family HTH domain